MECLRFRFLLFFCLSALAACAQFFLLPLRAALIALRASDDVYHDPAVVFTALWACAVRDAKRAAFTRGKLCADQRMMRAPLGGLGVISTHSDYHRRHTIRDL